MIRLAPDCRVYLFLGPTDMRRGFLRLSQMVEEEFGRSAIDGGLFVFFSRRQDRVKILFWDDDGFVFREELEHLIDEKSKGNTVSLEASEKEGSKVIDLVEALKKSVKEKKPPAPRSRRKNEYDYLYSFWLFEAVI